MRNFLRASAVVVLWVSVVLWIAQGAHMGWSATSRAVEKIDPVTEQTYPHYVEGFFPGVDFLGCVIIVSALLFGSSFLVRKKY